MMITPMKKKIKCQYPCTLEVYMTILYIPELLKRGKRKSKLKFGRAVLPMILGRVLKSFIPLSDEERFFNAKQWVKRKFT